MYNPLTILMWRHCIVRYHKFISTIFEFASVIVLFVLMFSVKELLFPKETHHIAESKGGYRVPEIMPLERIGGPISVVFTPYDDITVPLMERVAKELKLNWVNKLPGKSQRGYFGLSNDSVVAEYARNMHYEQAVVVFKDAGKDLDYAIRMKGSFLTHTYEAADGNMGPHENFGLSYEMFLRLQWAIDKSYIELRTDRPINQEIILQMFPYEDVEKKDWMETIVMLALAVCQYSLFLPFVFLMSRLVEERVTGVQELIKMAGVSKLTLNFSHFLNCAPAGILFGVSGAIFLSVGTPALLPNTNPLLVLIVLVMHYETIITLAMLCSFITNKKQYSVTLATILFVILDIPARLVAEVRVWAGLRALTGLLPHAPLIYFWREVNAMENFDKGITFSNMFEAHSDKSLSVFVCMIMMVLQTTIYAALVAYLVHVRPGPYGSPQPWNFLWKARVVPSLVADDREPVLRDARYYEPAAAGKAVGIRVTNVTKIYGKDIVLNNVSLDIYQGEITVLLGHNGAGKTTLMNIITGMIPPTEGSVEVNGNVRGRGWVRRELGLCPQHNMFLPALTVTEHVVFFAMLKGQTYRSAVESSAELLSELGLSEKANCCSEALSGGMQRRLQLACALSGRASVLVLDEPTSGLDVQTRRELWDLLLNLRGSRTVVLSTHFMEEADALGDRVAALQRGALVCHATPIFLKSNVGTGYILTLSTSGPPREPEVTQAVTSHVPEAKLRAAGPNSLTYNLPTHASKCYPELFKNLESERSQLGIENIGVGMSTLEEVFIKLCSNHTMFADDENCDVPDTVVKLIRPPLLYWRQLCALLKRQVLFILSSKFSFLIFQILIPVTFIFLTTYLVGAARSDPAAASEDEHDLTLSLDIYKDVIPRRVFYDVAHKEPIEELAGTYANSEFIPSGDIVADTIRLSETDYRKYQTLIAGFKMNDTTFHVFYTTLYRHAMAVGLNLVSNSAMRLLDSGVPVPHITTHNRPPGLPRTQQPQPDFNGPPGGLPQPQPNPNELVALPALITWLVFILMIVLSTALNVVTLLVREVRSGTRRLHTMAGCPAALHWAARLAFHLALYTLTLIVPVVIALKSFSSVALLSDATYVMALIMLLSVAAWLSFIYLLSFKLSEGAAATLLSVLLILGIICAVITTLEWMMEGSIGGWVLRVVTSLSGAVLPPHRAAAAALRLIFIANKCAMASAFSPHISNGTCSDSISENYLGWKEEQPSHDMLALFLQFCVYMTLVILTEEGVFNLIGRVYAVVYKPRPARYHDRTAKAEALYVHKAIERPSHVETQDCMLVSDLHKTYLPMFGRPVRSVNGVSLSVKKGECFGLLGVNGAGKSTTFKMMVAEVSPTRGHVWANGFHLKFPKRKYLQSLSYCPQFLGVDGFLSGHQNLALLLTMRGLHDSQIRREVKSWIAVVGLERLQDLPVRVYSGGCARRVSAAGALCAAAALTLLDEPTAGVDVAARRRVWAAIKRAQNAKRAVVLTSHSLDEMEALCARIGILSAGEVCALGSPHELRANYAKGFSLRLKLAAFGDSETTDRLQSLKSDMMKTFECRLKDEHKTMLLYHIDETIPYSDLFARLESLKTSHSPYIEDYTVSETTLEEVFLSFAQDAQKPTCNGAGDAV